MSRVTFTYKSGRVQEMELRYADPLSKLGHGTYMTRDMQAAAVRPVVEEHKPDEIESLREEYKTVVGKKAYHGWTADELREKIAGVR